MKTAASWSVALQGISGTPVEVESAVGGGLPRTVIVGLPDAALNEARDRVRAALAVSEVDSPAGAITINLSPASLPKNGSHYDLAIAAAILAASGQVPAEATRGCVCLGELGLDGKVRRVRGILPALLAAAEAGFERAVVPAGQASEAALVPGLRIRSVRHLDELVAWLRGEDPPEVEPEPSVSSSPAAAMDLAEVHGHEDGKWALEIAAAGRHHLFFHGAPGVGKTMLAARLPSILPDLATTEAIEVSALHSLAGVALGDCLLRRPPYSDPHHSSTLASLIGGGAREIRPGAISMAHRGVLFLDEAPDFGSRHLDALRTPLESGWVTIGRARQQVRYPARFQLVLAANPCPCGLAGVAGRECHCAPTAVRRYQDRLSGPIRDRIDIVHQMLPLTKAYLGKDLETPESSYQVAQRVLLARERQARRLAGTPYLTNGEVPGPYLRKKLPLPEGAELLEQAMLRGRLSARGVDKVLRLAWTLADLAGHDQIQASELRVAMRLRMGEIR